MNPHNTSKVCTLPSGTWSGWGLASVSNSVTLAATTARALFQTSGSPYMSVVDYMPAQFQTFPHAMTLPVMSGGETVVFLCGLGTSSQALSFFGGASSNVDSLGNTWTKRKNLNGAADSFEIWTATNMAPGAPVVTANMVTPREVNGVFVIIKARGGAISYESPGPTSVNNPANTTAPSPSYSNVGQPCILLAIVDSHAVPTHTADSWTTIIDASPYDLANISVVYKYLEATGATQSTSWGLAASSASVSGMIALVNS